MTALNMSSIIASFVSVVIGILAIWLSIMFYRWSNEASEKVSDSAKEINAGVELLEKLFDTLYSDTFTIMKDTVSDMRRHAWNENAPSNDKKQEELFQDAVNKVRQETSEKISEILSNSNIQKTVKEQVQDLVNKAVTKSAHAGHDVGLEAVKEKIRKVLMKSPRAGLPVSTLWLQAGRPGNFFQALIELRQSSIVGWQNDEELKNADTAVYLT